MRPHSNKFPKPKHWSINCTSKVLPRAEFLRVRASIRLGGNDLEGAENDLKEAMQLDPNNTAITLQYANLLWHAKRTR